MNQMHPTQRALVDAAQDELKRLQIELAPVMAARPEAAFRDPEYRNLQVAQNVLRTCLEAVLSGMTPYGQLMLVEIAVRMASYAISAGPMEDQDAMLADVLQRLPPEHSHRVAQGMIIQTTWEQHGLIQPNVPGGRG